LYTYLLNRAIGKKLNKIDIADEFDWLTAIKTPLILNDIDFETVDEKKQKNNENNEYSNKNKNKDKVVFDLKEVLKDPANFEGVDPEF